MDTPEPELPPPEPNFLERILLWICGADDYEALRQCPRDRGSLLVPGLIQFLSFLYLTGLFTLCAHMLFAPPGQFRFELLAVGAFLGFFLLVIDSWMILRASHFQTGAAQLRKAGADISGGLIARLKIGIAWIIRFILSLSLAQLTALMLTLMIFAPDINAWLQHEFLQTDAHLLGPATALVDGEIRRETTSVADQTRLVNTLTQQVASLRQITVDPFAGDPEIQEAQQEVAQLVAEKAKADEDVQAAQTFADNEFGGIKGAPGNSGVPGYGLRWRAAMERVAQAKARAEDIETQLEAARARLDALRKQKSSANATLMQQAQGQLPAFEKKLTVENGRLKELKDQLASSIANRDEDIRKAIQNAPDFVGIQTGMIARVVALEAIVQHDKRLQFVLLLIEVVSLSLESAALLAKIVCPIPSRYASLVAGDAYMHDVRVVNEMMDELNKRDGDEPGQSGAPSPIDPIDPIDRPPGSGGAAMPMPIEPANEPAPDAEPPKRGRGRPRIHPVETHPPRKWTPRKDPALTVITGGIEQGPSGQQPEPPRPA